MPTTTESSLAKLLLLEGYYHFMYRKKAAVMMLSWEEYQELFDFGSKEHRACFLVVLEEALIEEEKIRAQSNF